jgi:ArsR family transcriptional regulator
MYIRNCMDIKRRQDGTMGAAATAGRARLLRTMAHPTRLAILKELVKGTRCVNDIRDLVKLPQPNVSQHLALLKANGLVASYKQGVRRCYLLTNPAFIRGLFAALGPERPTPARRAPTSPRPGTSRRSRTR